MSKAQEQFADYQRQYERANRMCKIALRIANKWNTEMSRLVKAQMEIINAEEWNDVQSGGDIN